MKNKRNVVIVGIILIIIIVAILAIIKIVNKNDEKEQKLLKIYNELEQSQTYLFEMSQSDNSKTIMTKKNNKTLIDQYSKDSHTTTLVKEDTTYLILHDRKEYYIYKQNNIEQNFLTDGIAEIVSRDFITGTEKVKGKKYDYEEYSGSTMFMMSTSLAIEESEIKTRFYFDKDDNLVYVKTIYGDNQELLKINLQHEVEDSVFEIPSDYAEN